MLFWHRDGPGRVSEACLPSAAHILAPPDVSVSREFFRDLFIREHGPPLA